MTYTTNPESELFTERSAAGLGHYEYPMDSIETVVETTQTIGKLAVVRTEVES